MIKLSIIIPAYNAEAYIHELFRCLAFQMTNEVEVIVVDDGSKVPVSEPEYVKLIRQDNLGVSAARNRGLDEAQGEYIAFIDADDLVSDNYVKTILDKIDTEHPDYIYLSWKTMGTGWKTEVKLTRLSDSFPGFNLCVWNRVYKRSMIGDVRFNEAKKIAEDAEFIRSVNESGHRKAFISDYMYFYRSDSQESLTKRFARGEIDFKRIVYHFQKVTKDMTYLVDEFREADKDAEVILMTHDNQIPELARYAMVILPCAVKGTELRGEPTRLFTKIEPPIKTQVVIYTSVTFNIGGIETFIYNFCRFMHDKYDLLVLYDVIDSEQLIRLQRIVPCVKNTERRIICDTIIVNRITDPIPKNVTYGKSVQMVHACKMDPRWEVPTTCDEIVCVSNVVRKSFDLKTAKVINNLVLNIRPKNLRPPLILVTASRLSTFEKGSDRMIKFAQTLEHNGIDYLWLVFADKTLKDAPQNMVFLPPRLDISAYMALADYVVQLSDAEGFGYSIVEALDMGTPVITTPVDVLPELGFVDGTTGYVVPFDIAPDDIDLSFLYKRPTCQYVYENESKIKQWVDVLGEPHPTHSYRPPEGVAVKVITTYYDKELKRDVKVGEIIYVPSERAEKITKAGFGRIYK